MGSILKTWVNELGLRHQGVLISSVRGCDSAPKDDASKMFVRCYREVILNAHCGDSAKSQSYIEKVDQSELHRRFDAFRKNLDHYEHHYVMHLIHAIGIIGYKHPISEIRTSWHYFYRKLVDGLHMLPETEALLDERLNADEETFGARD